MGESVSAPCGVDDDPPESERVLPGDRLVVTVQSANEQRFENIDVDARGGVRLPLIGSVAIGGLTLQEAEETLSARYRSLDKFAEVSIELTTRNGHRATVIGAVQRPGMFEVVAGLRVADLVAQAGGPRDQAGDTELVDLADLESARLVRRGRALPISVVTALEGNVRHNVQVRAGDLLYVPPSRGRSISVLGEVKNAKVVPFRRGIRLTEVLALAGGASSHADNGDIRIVRGSLARPRVYTASLRDLVRGRGTDIELRPGDVVFVTEHWFATVSDVIQRVTPLIAASALVATLAR